MMQLGDSMNLKSKNIIGILSYLLVKEAANSEGIRVFFNKNSLFR